MNLSLSSNILVNYVSQIYCILIAMGVVPLYLHYMGAEAYGLVGFFAMLQAWFQILDMGLTPAMVREVARFRGGASDLLVLRRLLRSLEGVFTVVTGVCILAMVACADIIARNWLQVQRLPLEEVRNALMLIGAIIALRWMSGLYRSVINGFERFVWLSGFNMAITSIRFVMVIPFFILVGTSPTDFFGFQLLVAIIEVVLLVRKAYGLLPNLEANPRVTWEWTPLRGVLKFSMSVAFSSSVWVVAVQSDKLVLSKLLPLDEYGRFTVAVLVASIVLIVSGPVSLVLLPRMARLSAEGSDDELLRLYRRATQLVGVLALPAALVLAFFAEQALWAWTGDAELARKSAPVLTLYALGNGIAALGAFPYYLQFAKGDLRLHLIGSVLFVALLVPAVIWTTWNYGMVGAGYAWLCANALCFLFWVPKVHERLVQGLHAQWLSGDVGGIMLTTTAAACIAWWLVKWPLDRAFVALAIIVVSLFVLITGAFGSSLVRETVMNKWRSLLLKR